MSATAAVELVLDPHAVDRLDALDRSWREHCGDTVAVAVATGTADLGVPLHAEVSFRAGAARRHPGGGGVGVRLAGVACPSPSLARDGFQHYGRLGRPCYAAPPGPDGLLADLLDAGRLEDAATLLGGVAREAVLDDAGTLARRGLVRGVPERSVPALARILELGFALDDDLRAALTGSDPADADGRIEELISAAAPAHWSIAVHPAHLDALTHAVPDTPPLAGLAEALFTTRGVVLPPMVLVPDPTLPEHSTALVHGGRRTPPVIGLPADRVLVPDVSGTASDPLTGRPARVADAADVPPDDQGGEAVVRSGDLLAAHVYSAVGALAPCTVTTDSTRAELDLLAAATPALAEAAAALLPELTMVRRALVRDGISVRDSAELAQAVVDAAVREPSGSPATMLASVRLALASTVAAGAADDDGTLLTRDVPPDLLDARHDDEHDVERVAGWVASTLADLGPDAVLVTPAAPRAAVADIVRRTHPGTRVLADTEVRAAR